MRGKKTLPEVKKQNGTYRDDRHLPDAVKGDQVSTLPTPPKTLHKDAHETWYVQATALMQMRILSAGDFTLLAAYCNEVLKYNRATDALEDDEMIVSTNSGATQMVNPLFKVQNDALNNMLAISKKFGFTPLDRMDIGASKTDKNDPLKDMF